MSEHFNVGDIVAKLNSPRLYIVTRCEYEILYVRPLISVIKGNPSNEKDFFQDELRMVHRSATNEWVKKVTDMSIHYDIDTMTVNINIVNAVSKGMADSSSDFKKTKHIVSKPEKIDTPKNRERFEGITKSFESNARYDSLTKVDEILDAINDLSLLHKTFGDEDYVEAKNMLIKKLENGEYNTKLA